jgi:hypothetical protein
MRIIVSVALIASLAAGCDDNGQKDSHKYSRSDVEHAFRSQGLELFGPDFPEVTTLVTKTGEEVDAFIYPNDKEAVEGLRALRNSSDTFAVRKKNVVVLSAATAPMRKRIRGALAQLG